MFTPRDSGHGKSRFIAALLQAVADNHESLVLIDPHGPSMHHWMERALKVVDRLHLPLAQAPFALDHLAELEQQAAEDIDPEDRDDPAWIQTWLIWLDQDREARERG